MLFKPTPEIAGSFFDAVRHLTHAGFVHGGSGVVWYGSAFNGTNIPAIQVMNAVRDGHSILEIEAMLPAMSVEQLDAVEAWRIRNFGSAHEKMALTAKEGGDHA